MRATLEIHAPGEAAVEAILTDEHAASSHGQPVLLIDGTAHGFGDLRDGTELRVRDPKHLEWAQRSTEVFPHLAVAVSHGGPRGGGAPVRFKDRVVVRVYVERLERDRIKKAAAATGQTMSDFLRELAMKSL